MEDKRNSFLNGCKKNKIDDPWNYVKTLYLQGLSCNALSELFLEKYQIRVSAKHLSENIRKMGILRGYKERKLNAMKMGRMVYVKKPAHQLYKRKSISAKMRAEIMYRDKYRCILCGNGPKNGYSIEVHHINGPESAYDNLEVLCFECHRGKHSK